MSYTLYLYKKNTQETPEILSEFIPNFVNKEYQEFDFENYTLTRFLNISEIKDGYFDTGWSIDIPYWSVKNGNKAIIFFHKYFSDYFIFNPQASDLVMQFNLDNELNYWANIFANLTQKSL